MSIIDEAMKKSAQTSIPNKLRQSFKIQGESKILFRILGLLPIFILLLIGILYFVVPKHPAPLPKVVTKVVPQPKKKISIEGVFISDTTKIVYINNQEFQVGDQIQGMKIAAINLDSIILQHQNEMLELHTGSAYML